MIVDNSCHCHTNLFTRQSSSSTTTNNNIAHLLATLLGLAVVAVNYGLVIVTILRCQPSATRILTEGHGRRQHAFAHKHPFHLYRFDGSKVKLFHFRLRSFAAHQPSFVHPISDLNFDLRKLFNHTKCFQFCPSVLLPLCVDSRPDLR